MISRAVITDNNKINNEEGREKEKEKKRPSEDNKRETKEPTGKGSCSRRGELFINLFRVLNRICLLLLLLLLLVE